MKKKCLLMVFFFFQFICQAQRNNRNSFLPPVNPEDTLPAKVSWYIKGDSVHFSSELRPLRQLAGAPKCFYDYFWEFGDGSFSYDKAPVHHYKDTGTYMVRLYATNFFDDGQAPPAKPYPVKIEKSSPAKWNWVSNFFIAGDRSIKMKVNSVDHKPGEDFVVLLGYQNKSVNNLRGSIVLFYNDKQYNRNLFALTDRRTFHGEENSTINRLLAKLSDNKKNSPLYNSGSNDNFTYVNNSHTGGHSGPEFIEEDQSNELLYSQEEYQKRKGSSMNYTDTTRSIIKELNEEYAQYDIVQFDDLAIGEERFMFMAMHTLPEMLQDTDATITMKALFIPDDQLMQPETCDLEMQLSTSHDPNRFMLKPHFINYRFVGKKKELTYKVQFQNTGEGSVKKVGIDIAMPKQLNMSTLKIKQISPQCVWCDSAYRGQSCIDTVITANGIYFVFNNISLPGLQQNLVKDKDSTKGFVEYSVKFKKKPKKKLPFKSSASIVFDNNKPITTNKATARFVKGFSPGIVAGYNLSLSDGNYSSTGPLQIGYTLAPYAPSRPYFQFEIYTGFSQTENFSSGVDVKKVPPGFEDSSYIYSGYGTDSSVTRQRNLLQLVPLHFRYNINDWIGVGVGLMAQILISEKTTTEEKSFYNYSDYNNQIKGDTTFTSTTVSKVGMGNLWDEANAALFADIQFGRVLTTGPSIGLRYIRQFKGNISNHFFLYAAFRL
jgi:PKD repeat protein